MISRYQLIFLEFYINSYFIIMNEDEIYVRSFARYFCMRNHLLYHLSWVTLYMWQVLLWDYLPPLLLSSYFYQASSFGLSNWSTTSFSKYRDQYLKSLKRFFEGNYKWVQKNIFIYLYVTINISLRVFFLFLIIFSDWKIVKKVFFSNQL